MFHYIWLRDCCYCEHCGDCYSSLRRYVPGLDTLRPRPVSLSWSESALQITWDVKNHRSTYAPDWLYANRYDTEAREARRAITRTWDSTTDLSDTYFDFSDTDRDGAARLALHEHIISNGFAIVRGGPAKADGVLTFAELVGEVTQSAYGAVFDLKPGSAAGTAGTTLMPVPPHSDEAFAYAPPGIEVLACIRPADTGGDSILVDGVGIAHKLRAQNPESFQLLAQWNHHYVRFHPGKLNQHAYAPIIALDDDGEVSGIRLHTRASAPLDLPEDIMEDYLIAYHRLCALMMAPENQLHLKLDAGDAIIFDNHRALHARTEFSDRQRHLQICGVPREKFHESFRLLAQQLGEEDTSNLVLRAGACR